MCWCIVFIQFKQRFIQYSNHSRSILHGHILHPLPYIEAPANIPAMRKNNKFSLINGCLHLPKLCRSINHHPQTFKKVAACYCLLSGSRSNAPKKPRTKASPLEQSPRINRSENIPPEPPPQSGVAPEPLITPIKKCLCTVAAQQRVACVGIGS